MYWQLWKPQAKRDLVFLWKDCTSSVSVTEQVLPHNLGFTHKGGNIRAVPPLFFSHTSSFFTIPCFILWNSPLLSPILPFPSASCSSLVICSFWICVDLPSEVVYLLQTAECCQTPTANHNLGLKFLNHWPEPQCWVCLCQTVLHTFFLMEKRACRVTPTRLFKKGASPHKVYSVFSFHKLDL